MGLRNNLRGFPRRSPTSDVASGRRGDAQPKHADDPSCTANIITAFGLARNVNEGDYWVAAEAYVALFTSLLLSDLTTAVMAGTAAEVVHLFTKALLIIGGYGATDGLVLIPIEAAIAALITIAMIRRLRST